MKGADPSNKHIGPMAQDFHAAFELGTDDKTINTSDAQGVALAAIQGLYQLLQEKDAEIADLEARLAVVEQKAAARTTPIDEIVHAVANALDGCASAPARRAPQIMRTLIH